MTEQHKVDDSRLEITVIKADVADIKEQTQEMYNALMGNKLTLDGGMIRRLQNLEAQSLKQDIRIEAITKQEDKKQLYLGSLFSAIGVVAGMIIAYIINLFK